MENKRKPTFSLMAISWLAVLCAAVLVISAAAEDNESTGLSEGTTDREGKSVWPFVRKRTTTILTNLLNSTQYSSCSLAQANPYVACTRRKKRSFADLQIMIDDDTNADDLDSSLDNIGKADETEMDERDSRYLFYHISSYYINTTSTSYIQGTTISFRVQCTIPNAADSDYNLVACASLG